MTAKRKATEPAPLVGAALGRVAYESWVGARPPGPDPVWDQLDSKTAAAWCVAAQAVLTATYGRTTT